MSQGRLGPNWDEYLAVLREDAHLLLAWGYNDTRRELPNARDEYDITIFSPMQWNGASMIR